MNKKYLFFLVFMINFFFLSSCNVDHNDNNEVITQLTIAELSKYHFIGSHRGQSGYPENSYAAIDASIKAGYQLVEIDIMMTRDSIIVVHHDRTVDRLSTGEGKIDSLTYDDLISLDFGVKYGADFKGTRICTLEQILQLAKYNNICLEIDLTTFSGKIPDVARKCYQEVDKYGLTRSVIFNGYWDTCKLLEELSDGTANISIVYNSSFKKAEQFAEYRNDYHLTFASISEGNFTKELCDVLHYNGIKTEVWIINDLENAKSLFEMGCDYILTDSIPSSFVNNMLN